MTPTQEIAECTFIAFLPGLIGGGVAGSDIENHIDHQSQINYDQNSINTLIANIPSYSEFAHKPAALGNTAVESFFKKQENIAFQKISSLKTSEPHHSTGEDIAFQGGGALIGLVALTALIRTATIAKRRRAPAYSTNFS